MKKLMAIAGAAALGLGVQGIQAADFDGSRTLLCATVQAAECDFAETCLSGEANLIDMAEFLRVNFKKKEIQGVLEDQERPATKIQSMQKLEDRVEKTVKDILKKANIVTSDELKAVKKEVRELKKMIASEKEKS